MPASTLSHHLERLASSGRLGTRREETLVYYKAEYGELRALTVLIGLVSLISTFRLSLAPAIAADARVSLRAGLHISPK